MARRILVVDDNPTNLKLVTYLVKANGYDVDTAADAEAALTAIARNRPDLILMDLQLPGIDGLELTRRLKTDPATADIRIIAVTAYGGIEHRAKTKAAGFEQHLLKPLAPQALFDLLESTSPPSK